MPGSEQAYVEERKILEYLLNEDHAVGGSKARFFFARGFDRAFWRRFADALVGHGQLNDVVGAEATTFGVVYEVRCILRTPDGTDPCIRTVWIAHEEAPPRLVTAYPF